MKSKLVIATVLTVMSFQAMAVGLSLKGGKVEAETKRLRKASELVGAPATAGRQEMKTFTADKLVEITKANVDKNDLLASMGRTIKGSNAKGEVVEISVLDLGLQLVGAKTAVEAVRADHNTKRAELSKAELAELNGLEVGIRISTEALALLSKVSKVDATTTKEVADNVALLERQVSMIRDMFPRKLADGTTEPAQMNLKEMLSHASIFELAIKAKTTPDVRGDVAMNQAYKEKYQDKAEQKKEEMRNCLK